MTTGIEVIATRSADDLTTATTVCKVVMLASCSLIDAQCVGSHDQERPDTSSVYQTTECACDRVKRLHYTIVLLLVGDQPVAGSSSLAEQSQ